MAKELGESTLEGASASKSGGDNSGVTGSSRDYRKSGTEQKMPSMKPDFNPMNCKPSTYGINGVGKED